MHNVFGSMRLRYFGPRPLIEDNSVRSKATSLVNLEGGYRLVEEREAGRRCVQLFNAKDSDIDYYYTSRLPGEPAGRHQRHPPSSDAAAHRACQPRRRHSEQLQHVRTATGRQLMRWRAA